MHETMPEIATAEVIEPSTAAIAYLHHDIPQESITMADSSSYLRRHCRRQMTDHRQAAHPRTQSQKEEREQHDTVSLIVLSWPSW